VLAAGLSCIAAGDFVYALYERVLHGSAPFPSLAYPVWDVLFLALLVRLRQVEEQSDQLAALARHDGLTGIPNRRTWDSELPVAMDRARRDGVPLSVAILDLDHFKHFNDRFGHQAGDRLLKSATTAWSQLLRSTDLLCRYGGEEFSVLLPDATIEQAAEVLERLRRITPPASCSCVVS